MWSVVLEEGVQWEEQEPDRGYSFASREGRARVLTCGAHGQKGGVGALEGSTGVQ